MAPDHLGHPGDGTWRNWSGTHEARPARVARPRDVAELAREVAAATARGLRVRAVGAGHSFSAAAVTEGLHLHLDALDEVERVDVRPDGTARVTVGAGVRLRALNTLLAARGLALPNLGDVDVQSLAGAVSTGTHGTGARLRSLSSQVVGCRLVTPTGDVIETSVTEDRELFEVARLGLGTAGVIAAVTLEVVPAFRLRAHDTPVPLDALLADLDARVDRHDHLEFFWFARASHALLRCRDRMTDDEPDRPLPRWRHLVDDELLANGVFELTNRLATAAPATVPALNAIACRALTARTWTGPSAHVLVTSRRVRFRESEYAVPREHVVEVVREVDRWLRRSREPVPFPLEVRFSAADDLWLSPAHGRATAWVAAQQYHRLPHARYLDAFERIVAQVAGRPHWGKLHTLGHERLAALYPRLPDVQRVRARVDPGGTFRNAYVDRVLGV